MTTTFEPGQRIQLPDEQHFVVVDGAMPTGDGGWRLYVVDDGGLRSVTLVEHEVDRVQTLSADGDADPVSVLAGLWSEWMRAASAAATVAALATTPLNPYPHQNTAVYGAMLPQPLLRFLLADEPGTGKTIMGGMWLREMQRLGFINRALIVAPAHLVSKWIDDFERFLGGGVRRVTADSVREEVLALPHDVWVVSLELAAVNPSVFEALHPARAGWDAVIFDEAHRLTPTAQAFYRVGQSLATSTPRVLLMTATPHRGNEWLFRSLMHLVDPKVFPDVERVDGAEPARALRPGPLHFLRRMKEELVDYDGITPLFKKRAAVNVPVPLNVDERTFYNEALDMVERYFQAGAQPLARMVYGKRAASSLYALRETLRRRRDAMGTRHPEEAAIEVDPNLEAPEERDLARIIHESSTAAREERKEIDGLVERLTALLGDPSMAVSKWPKLDRACLQPHRIEPSSAEQLVVFTEYADTADWLVGYFRAMGYTSERYSGRDPHGRRDEIRSRFMARQFQVLVSTDAGNEGIDLQSAHVLVNWDIPWSLVRLEQRMGRIHRVGQTEDVTLFSLVATDTREGDAHLVLLRNLVAAANELGGKMFDSLSLVGELVAKEIGTDDLERLLERTFSSDRDERSNVLRAVQAITTERLRIAHDRARRQEDELADRLDVSKAYAALQDERLQRINPHLVERYLSRLATAGLIAIDKAALADEGLWFLRPRSLRSLPPDLDRDGRMSVLVATMGAAKRQAMEAGHPRAAQAVGLGPSEPSFRSLVGAASKHLHGPLWQGGALADPTTVTDYDLFSYRVTVSEGGGRRQTPRSYLVRVDDVGARVVNWELLANLEPGAGRRPQHPARLSDADAATAARVEEDTGRRRRALDDWLADARRQLLQLPTDLTDDIGDRELRIKTRGRLRAAVDERLNELNQATEIAVGDIELVGWAHVHGRGAPTDPTAANSEEIAMRHVTGLLRAGGWAVADRHNERPGPGFDLHARKGRHQRCVEVKGVWRSAASEGVTLTGNELAKAGLLGDDYWLYVVDQCHDGQGTLFAAFQEPARIFADAVLDVPVLRIRGSDLVAAKDGAT